MRFFQGGLATFSAVVLACFLIFSPSAVSAAGGPGGSSRIALIIGNGSYASAPLANPVKDARIVAQALRDVGFDVMEHLDTDKRAMKRAIRDFGERLEDGGTDTVGLFFYAGHGVGVDGRNYLIPIGAKIERERDVDAQAVSADAVLGAMAFAQNRLNFVVLDACRNNPYSRSLRSATRGLARMDAPRGTLIAYATGPGEVAADGAGSNSPYSAALARAVREPGLPAEQVFKRVRVAVMAETGQTQIPWETSSLTGDFFFNTEGVGSSGSPTQAMELAFWNSIRASWDAADFDAYLAQFPNGVFSSVATRRIEDISEHNAYWAKLQANDKSGAMRSYLSRYPEGPHAKAVRLQFGIEKNAQVAALTPAKKFNPDGKWKGVATVVEDKRVCPVPYRKKEFDIEIRDGKGSTRFFSRGSVQYVNIKFDEIVSVVEISGSFPGTARPGMSPGSGKAEFIFDKSTEEVFLTPTMAGASVFQDTSEICRNHKIKLSLYRVSQF